MRMAEYQANFTSFLIIRYLHSQRQLIYACRYAFLLRTNNFFIAPYKCFIFSAVKKYRHNRKVHPRIEKYLNPVRNEEVISKQNRYYYYLSSSIIQKILYTNCYANQVALNHTDRMATTNHNLLDIAHVLLQK